MNFKTLRITLLLLVLAYVGFDTFLSNARATNWERPLRMVIYPINVDASENTDDYIASLTTDSFATINDYLLQQAKQFGKHIEKPLYIALAPPLKTLPPKRPQDHSLFDNILWSIKLRYWSWKTDNYTGPKPQIRSYAMFYDPTNHQRLKHSTGLKKGKIAINHIFAGANYTSQNNVVILHELLHTLGASDKYELHSGLPHFPDGYAEPNRKPLYPQSKAEIMGGHIALSETKSKMPKSLQQTTIGRLTAEEIHLID